MTANEKLTNLANSIRTLNGVTGALTLDAMTSKVTDANTAVNNAFIALASKGVTVPTEARIGDLAELVEDVPSADTSIEDALISGDVTTYINERVSTIAEFAFYHNASLASVSFPTCTTIGSSAFHSCPKLTSVSFPACTTIKSNAFMWCTSLTSVNFPVCDTVEYAAFAYCSKLTSVSFPACTTIGDLAFSSCTSLTSVNFPVCTTIGSGAFRQCSKLTSVSFPACTTISDYAFRQCSLVSVSFPACTTIKSNAFYGCSNLNKIYLTSPSICSLAHSNAFSNTSIGSNKGSIFAPASLVSSYKTATNWAFFSNRIYSI